MSVGITPFSRNFAATAINIEREGPHADGNKSISTFYSWIELYLQQAVELLGEEVVFSGNPALQVVVEAPTVGEFVKPIANLQDALDGLAEIADQGGGLNHTLLPGKLGGNLSHYARFTEVYYSREFAPGDLAHHPPTGPAMPINWSDTRNFTANPSYSDFPPGSAAHDALRNFAGNYTQMLVALHVSFNGQPTRMVDAVMQMYQLSAQAESLMAIPDPRFHPGDNMVLGPAYEYLAEASSFWHRI